MRIGLTGKMSGRVMRIGISGKMCSGKSVVANYLVREYGFAEYSFAKRLKELADELFGIKGKGKRERYMLQQLAEHLRAVDPHVWVRYLVGCLPAGGDIVVSDVRYPNEYDTLKRLGFIMVRMVQDRVEQERLVTLDYPDLPLILLDDFSETALDDCIFDKYVYNCLSDNLNDVYRQVDRLIAELEEIAY